MGFPLELPLTPASGERGSGRRRILLRVREGSDPALPTIAAMVRRC
jgi:hypothetical protein